MRTIKIGKSHSNDIVIDGDSTVSREHLEIFIDDDLNVFVTDKNSLNGTFVNGTKIFEPKQLGRYDILRIGNTLINWRDYLDSEDSGYDETVMDNRGKTRSVYDSDDFHEDDSQKKKKRNRTKIYIGSLIVVIIAVTISYFYFSQDSEKITTTWKSKDKSGLSYTFNDDGTFEKDSNDITKTGTYTIIEGRENKIKLKFNKKSLPVYSNSLISNNTNKSPYPSPIDYERQFENYWGNVFKLTNSTDYDIQILSITQETIFKEVLDVNSKVYISKKDYRSSLNQSREYEGYSYTLKNDWKLISNVHENISDSKLSHLNIEDLIIKEGETLSIMVITKEYVNHSYGEENHSDENLSISDGISARTFGNEFYHYTDVNAKWNGKIEYGIIKSDYELDYEFVGGNLELNGKIFKRK